MLAWRKVVQQVYSTCSLMPISLTSEKTKGTVVHQHLESHEFISPAQGILKLYWTMPCSDTTDFFSVHHKNSTSYNGQWILMLIWIVGSLFHRIYSGLNYHLLCTKRHWQLHQPYLRYHQPEMEAGSLEPSRYSGLQLSPTLPIMANNKGLREC